MSDKKGNWFTRHKILTLILVIVVLAIFSGGSKGESDSNRTVSPSPNQSEVSQQKLTTLDETGKRTFNDLGWAIYVTQFEKDQPANASECKKDMATCEYWSDIASRFTSIRVDQNDVKYAFYDVGNNIYLDPKRQAIYDEYTVGLQKLTPQTELAGEVYKTQFVLRKITAKEIATSSEFEAILMRGLLTNVPIGSPKASQAPTTSPRPTATPAKSTDAQPTFPSREQAEATIKANASKEWGDDYSMVQYEIDKQLEAYSWLVQQSQYPSIMAKAKREWGDDYSMVKYEYEKQVTAYKSL